MVDPKNLERICDYEMCNRRFRKQYSFIITSENTLRKFKPGPKFNDAVKYRFHFCSQYHLDLAKVKIKQINERIENE